MLGNPSFGSVETCMANSRSAAAKLPGDVYRVASARLVSEVGDQMALIALLFRVKDLGPWAVSGIFAAGAATRMVAAPWAGLIVDRFRARSLIRTVSIAQAIVCCLLAVASGPVIYLLVVMLSVGTTIVLPSWQALIPKMVRPEDLSRAYATVQTFRSVSVMVGAGVGGAVVALIGNSMAFLVDAATFAAVAGFTLFIRVDREPALTERVKGAAMRGFSAIWRSPILRSMAIMLTVFNMTIGVVEVLGVFIITDALGGGPSAYGLMYGLMGGATLLSGLVAARRRMSWSNEAVVIAGAVTAATGVLVLSLAPALWIAGIANVVIGFGMTGLNGFASPVIVENSEDSERGRIFATSTALTTMGFVVALAVSGAIGEVLTPRQGVFVGSALCLVALAVNGSKVMREVGRKSVDVA